MTKPHPSETHHVPDKNHLLLFLACLSTLHAAMSLYAEIHHPTAPCENLRSQQCRAELSQASRHTTALKAVSEIGPVPTTPATTASSFRMYEKPDNKLAISLMHLLLNTAWFLLFAYTMQCAQLDTAAHSAPSRLQQRLGRNGRHADPRADGEKAGMAAIPTVFGHQ
ncbi:hypothetical protein DL89DRAFT_314847 [Linderina pennispora]|uniref:Uncharacterized protein n=1 Tax=Linderina pennispora TaxID=61395 RepID=A0A1Y1WAM7_9FUNG|nr:uncharacterized protein DL89DRAFT_314847 [Linderina pennispora]ORX70610.1 hypothetical protein DL89DRAFT_314847 [Linderina pennispora]